MATAFCDKLMAYDVEPEEWRKLDVSIGEPSTRRQVSHKDLTATISGMDSPGRLGVQDSDQAQAAGRYNYDHAAEKSFYAPKTPKMPKKNGAAPP